MEIKTVKDMMIPLSEYAVVAQDATLLDALRALDEAQTRLAEGKHRHRAMLVVDGIGKIVGKIGHLGFLKALEPKYSVLGDLPALTRAGVSDEFIASMMEHYQFFQESIEDLCLRGRTIAVKDVMQPVTECIEETATLREAMHRIVMWQALSIMVTRDGEIVGLVRLSDLYEEVASMMKAMTP